jgi:hypothetical protein
VSLACLLQFTNLASHLDVLVFFWLSLTPTPLGPKRLGVLAEPLWSSLEVAPQHGRWGASARNRPRPILEGGHRRR